MEFGSSSSTNADGLRVGWADGLSPDIAEKLLASMSDIALIIDADGVIHDVVLGNAELAGEVDPDWRGRKWNEIVTKESRPKVDDLIRGSLRGGLVQPREINHPARSGIDVPIRYSTMALGKSGRFVAIGRDLRSLAQLQRRLVETQEAMEQEYARMRAAETRYRMLFHLASEPVLIVDSITLRIVEANPAALRQIANGAERLVNQSILSCFTYDGAEALEAALKTARRAGKVPEVEARLAQNGQLFSVAASVFRQDQVVFLLVRLTPHAGTQPVAGGDGLASKVMGVIEQLPDGFVVIDGDLKIVECNQAFLDLAQLGAKTQALGEPLEHWLGRPGVDMDLIMARLEESRAMRAFATVLRGSYGSVEQVEVSAVPALSGEVPTYGFIIRNNGIRQALNGHRGRSLHRSVEQLTELVGRVSLKDMVRESSDMIERLCIEAALERSGDNRASAAQMLGLSRQSFYAKMRRHGLGDLDPEVPGEE
ncbi:MAG: transcriptional regulator PpsR [Beijerinckiaceae bacterium]|nr:transcriptional regulator PpsR [Beijerinckiaceae bacterium]